jgi:hypothetical protein
MGLRRTIDRIQALNAQITAEMFGGNVVTVTAPPLENYQAAIDGNDLPYAITWWEQRRIQHLTLGTLARSDTTLVIQCLVRPVAQDDLGPALYDVATVHDAFEAFYTDPDNLVLSAGGTGDAQTYLKLAEGDASTDGQSISYGTDYRGFTLRLAVVEKY